MRASSKIGVMFVLLTLLSVSDFSVVSASADEQLCNRLISDKAWRVFSAHEAVVTKETKSQFESLCSIKDGELAGSSLHEYNLAIVSWLNGDKESARGKLNDLSARDFDLARLSLALSKKSRRDRIPVLDRLASEGVKHAETELALASPVNKRNAKFILDKLSLKAKTNDPAAALKVAMVYLFPKTGFRDLKKVEFYLDFARLTKDRGHHYAIARLYSDFPGMENQAKFTSSLLKSVQLGHRAAINLLLGVMLKDGIRKDIQNKTFDSLCSNKVIIDQILIKINKYLDCSVQEIKVFD